MNKIKQRYKKSPTANVINLKDTEKILKSMVSILRNFMKI